VYDANIITFPKSQKMLPKKLFAHLQNHCVLLFGATVHYLALTGWLQLQGLLQPAPKQTYRFKKNIDVVFSLPTPLLVSKLLNTCLALVDRVILNSRRLDSWK
jgi:hypothetical protein